VKAVAAGVARWGSLKIKFRSFYLPPGKLRTPVTPVRRLIRLKMGDMAGKVIHLLYSAILFMAHSDMCDNKLTCIFQCPRVPFAVLSRQTS
jgi:hypothetical protein